MRQLWSFEFQKIVGRKLIRVALLAYGVLILILLSNSRVDFLDIFDQNGRHLHGKEALEYELKMAERYRGPVTEEKVDALLVQEKQGAKNAGMTPVWYMSLQNKTDEDVMAACNYAELRNIVNKVI